MSKSIKRSGLMATTTLCGALLSVALPTVVAVILPSSAEAQDYTSGAISIAVTDSNGAPVSGATVTLTSQAQGVSKTVTTSASGSATATGLAPGEYDVSVTASGFDSYAGTATVVVSQQVTYSYNLTTTGAATEVTVKGKRVRQDFQKVTQGLTVDLTTLTSQQAVGRNIESVTLMAPTAIRSKNLNFDEPSIGGGSAAENAFYINGLNITNPDNYVGGAQVPFDFYKTVDIQTSGYPAEFGRATGGVVNATTKSGSNNFMFAVHANFAPQQYRSQAFEASDTIHPAKFDRTKENTLTLESGGALIKDKLFLYGLVELNDNETDQASTADGYYERTRSDDPFYGAKVDWYLTPNQHFEATYFDTTTDFKIDRLSYTGSESDGSDAVIGASLGKAKQTTGGQNYVLKYTGNLTDWFTVSAAYGDNKDQNLYQPGDPSQPFARQYDPDLQQYVKISKLQPFSAAVSNETVERKFTRLDGDLRFEAFGRHHVRFGYDQEDLEMTHIEALPGAVPIRYVLRPSDGYGYIIYEHLGGHVTAKDSAEYIQDSWDMTPTLNLTFGLRNDDFNQNNLSGQQVLDLHGNIAPRIGVSWRPGEDSPWRFTASYGQYYIPPAMNLSFRGKDLYYEEGFDTPEGGYTYDPTTGLPVTMGTPDADIFGDSPCPTASNADQGPVEVPVGGNYCAVFGSGNQEPADKKAAVGLKATRESEVTLGTTYRANDMWTFGLSYVHRTLDRVSEDTDFAPQINAYCEAHATQEQLDGGACQYENEYHVWNVGQTVTINTFDTLPDGTKQLTLTNLGFPTPKRVYDAVTLDFKRAFDGKWGLQGSYTWSKSYGNYEGTVLTIGDGTGQTDAGSTLLYDYPELAANSTGYLANDRTHTFKVWGSYAITPEFMVGANIQIISPAKFSCLGTYPDINAIGSGYGAVSHFCFNGTTSEPSPMGKGGKSDWTKNIDLSLRYSLPNNMPLGGKLVLRADIFNLFDNKQVTARDMTSDTGSFDDEGNLEVNPHFYQPVAYNSARYMRIGFDLTY